MQNLKEKLQEKYPDYNIEEVSYSFGHKFQTKFCSVFTDAHNQHLIITPKGEKLYGTLKTVVTDEYNSQPVCVITLFCNIVADESQAKYLYHVNKI
jgi:hypothetical protein